MDLSRDNVALLDRKSVIKLKKERGSFSNPVRAIYLLKMEMEGYIIQTRN